MTLDATVLTRWDSTLRGAFDFYNFNYPLKIWLIHLYGTKLVKYKRGYSENSHMFLSQPFQKGVLILNIVKRNNKNS